MDSSIHISYTLANKNGHVMAWKWVLSYVFLLVLILHWHDAIHVSTLKQFSCRVRSLVDEFAGYFQPVGFPIQLVARFCMNLQHVTAEMPECSKGDSSQATARKDNICPARANKYNIPPALLDKRICPATTCIDNIHPILICKNSHSVQTKESSSLNMQKQHSLRQIDQKHISLDRQDQNLHPSSLNLQRQLPSTHNEHKHTSFNQKHNVSSHHVQKQHPSSHNENTHTSFDHSGQAHNTASPNVHRSHPSSHDVHARGPQGHIEHRPHGWSFTPLRVLTLEGVKRGLKVTPRGRSCGYN